MSRPSITLTRPKDELLKAQVERGEYTSRNEVVNDLIRKARESETIRTTLNEAEQSGFSDRSPDQIGQPDRASLIQGDIA